MTGEKKVKGRKRTLLVDTNGLVIRVLVHTADIQDSEGAEWLLGDHRVAFMMVTKIWADQGYKSWIVEEARNLYGIDLEIVQKPADQQGFVVHPRRWVVERTFAWLCRNRRLSKDYEHYIEYSESMIYIASIHLMLKRLTNEA